LSYLGETGQVTERQLVGGAIATSWSYLDNTGDRRLAVIDNVGLRKFKYTTTPENLITGIAEKACYSLPCSSLRNWSFGYDDADRLLNATVTDAAAPYNYTLDPAGNITLLKSPSAPTKAAAYNNVNELTSLAGQPFVYDANGNLVSDGQRNYAWDAENRLVKINNISSGTKTVLAYDGLDRRAAITTTTVGSPTTQYHLWCGGRPCQLRNADNTVARSFYREGEFIAGSATRLYYGPDQLGSVRDALAVGSVSTTVQTYNYDPYGNPTQSPPAGSQARFRYAGMFYHQDSGLYLTQYRAYDPRTGRWLSRDPLGEAGGANIFGYVGNNPVNDLDPLGLLQFSKGKIFYTLNGQTKVGVLAGKSTIFKSVTVYADDWTPIQAYINDVPNNSEFNYDCVGLTFGGAQVWIQDDQIPLILKGDGYVEVKSPQAGDVVIYWTAPFYSAWTGAPVHAATVISGNAGPVYVLGKGGITAPSITPVTPGPGGGWSDPNSTPRYYRKSK
jgi:RHS repeat-associated protein